MRWLIFLVLAASSWSVGSEASACSCMKLTPEEGLSSSHAVFSGEVTNIDKNEATRFGGLEVTLRVRKVWKGALGEEVQVHTAGSSAACGYPFEVGKTYLVYALHDEADPMRVSLCSRTALLEDAGEDLTFLGRPAYELEAPSHKGKDEAKSKDRCTASAPGAGGVSLVWAALFLLGMVSVVRRII